MTVALRPALVSLALLCAALSFLIPLERTARAQTATTSTSTVRVPAPTCQMSGNPNNGSITIRWSSKNAASAYITSVGSVDLSGVVNLVLPLSSPSTYVGTFMGPGGTVTCSVSAPPGMSGSSGSSARGGGVGGGTNSTDLTSNFSNSGGTQVNGTRSGTPTPSSNGGLVSCGFSSLISDKGVSATNCNLCDFATLIQNIINFLLAISTVIATGLFAYAGILFFSNATNPAQIQKAKEIFGKVLIGFIIALTGYLVVQTLLNVLVNQSSYFSGGTWFALQCVDKEHTDSSLRPRESSISALFGALQVNDTGLSQQFSTGVGNPSQVGVGDCSPSAMGSFSSSAAAMSFVIVP